MCLCLDTYTLKKKHFFQVHNLQALVVAGGQGGGSTLLDSVLTLLPAATAWTSLASLPRALEGVVASLVGGRIRLVGGRDGGGAYSTEVCISGCY